MHLVGTKKCDTYEIIIEEEKQETQKEMAKKIYVLFAQNMESLRTCLMALGFRSDKELATKLRAEIRKSRMVFSKKTVVKLMLLSSDFARSVDDITTGREFNRFFIAEGYINKCEVYREVIIPMKYDELEEILGEYLDLL